MWHRHANLKSVYDSWKETGENFISFERFNENLKIWAFVASEEEIAALFDWLDNDKDGQISYEDLRMTIGKVIAPV